MDLGEAREAELRDLVGRLERLIPREGAHLTIPSDPDANTSLGNRLGYLRLGVEFLIGALDPLPSSATAPARIGAELGYLLTPDSQAPFDLCEIDEAVDSRPPVSSPLGLLGQIILGTVLVSAVIFSLIGASVVWNWLFR